MSWLPRPVQELLEVALVAELTVVRWDGRAITYPVIPLWDGERIRITSSVLFSKKLEHLKREPRVSLSLSDPTAMGGRTDRATIQGEAHAFEGDPHRGWERLLPLWIPKEPSIATFLKSRVALPLFFERIPVEVVPRRVLYWPSGRSSDPPEISEPQDRAA